MKWVDLWQLLLLKTLMVGHGGSSVGSYLADPTSPIPSHSAVITLFKSFPGHQLSWLGIFYICFDQRSLYNIDNEHLVGDEPSYWTKT